MSIRKSLFGCLMVALVLVTMLHSVRSDIETNEVNDPDVYRVPVYPNDRQCVLVGGLCVKTSDCTEPTNNKGLCPTSVHHGVECCYELPVRPAPCAEHLGMCMDRCHQRLVRPGTDCVNGQVCCVLI